LVVLIGLALVATSVGFVGAAAATDTAPTCSNVGYETNASGWYEVENVSQLQCINAHGLGEEYVLVDDINAEDTEHWNGESNPKGFDPIGEDGDEFTGSFDGDGHTVSDLTIDRRNTNYVGLFGDVETGGVVTDTSMKRANVTGGDYTGILVGSTGGTVGRSSATGSVRGIDNVGGLVGENFDGIVSESFATGAVDGDYRVGGLVGWTRNGGTVSTSYATGTVSADTGHVGGLIGETNSDITVRNSYAAGSTSGGTNQGGLAGYSTGTDWTDAYWDKGRTNQGTARGSTSGGTSTNLQGFGSTGDSGAAPEMEGSWSESNMTGLDFTNSWTTVAGDYLDLKNNTRQTSTPHRSAPDDAEQARILDDMEKYDGKYNVTSDKVLQAINRNSTTRGWDYRLVVDVDANGTDQWNSGDGFEPIGENNDEFTGEFDGDNRTISNLSINRTSDFVGLFGKTGTSSTIRAVTLSEPNVTGKNDVGPLVGGSYGTVTQVRVDGGNVTTTEPGTADDTHLGGLVGGVHENTVSESYSSVTVDARDNDEVGGIAGDNGATVEQVYFSGVVENSGAEIGGILGDTNSGTTVSEVYMSGSVDGSGAGAIVGNNGGDADVIAAAYWDGSNDVPSAGVHSGTSGDVTNLSTSEMRGINATVEMYGLDFDDAWRPGDADYPDFAWDSDLDTSADILAGDGDDTPYQITDAYELQAATYNLSANYTLANDVDAPDTDDWFGGDGFKPIGDSSNGFAGTFDGAGHTISGLYVDRGSTDYVGLFGYIETGSSVVDLGLENATVTADGQAGTLAGTNDGTVERSFATGDLDTSGAQSGGLVGLNYGNILDTYASVNVSSTWNYVGGLVGDQQDGAVTHSFATGSVVGNNYVGGLVGRHGGGDVTDSYWDTESTNQSDSDGGTDLSTVQMTGSDAPAEMTGFAFTEAWVATDGYPTLAWNATDPVFAVDVTSTTSPVDAGDTLDVTANVTNWGADGTQTVTLTDTGFTDTRQDDLDVDLDSGESNDSVTLRWATGSNDDGTGDVTVATANESATATVTVDDTGGNGDNNGGGGDGPQDDDEDGPRIVREDVEDETRFEVAAGDENEVVLNVRGDADDSGDESDGTESTAGESDLDNVAVDSLSIRPTEDGQRDFEVTVREWSVDLGESDAGDGGQDSTETGESNVTGDGTNGASDDATDRADPHAFLEDTGSTAVGYVEVNHTNPDADIGDVTFRFRVHKSYLNETGVGPESVALYRDETERWNELDATRVNETDGYHVFQATSPGLSLFTIGSTRPVFDIEAAELSRRDIAVGGTVTIDATVRNLGGADGTHEVTLTADGERVSSADVNVDARSSETVSLSFDPGEAGEYNLVVDDEAAGVLSVEAVDDEDSSGDSGDRDVETDDTTGDSDESDGGGPNIVLVGGLLATPLVVLFAVVRRRRRDETEEEKPGRP
jgi:hypothetical protein